jgi:hypothetical protein
MMSMSGFAQTTITTMMNGEHADHIENGNPWKRQRKTVDS